jgi:hypothetical protein
MPRLELGYSLPTRTPKELRFEQATLDDVDVRGIGRTAQWVDLDGEGLPGLLSRQAGGFRYKRNLSGGVLAKGVVSRPSRASGPSRRASWTWTGAAAGELRRAADSIRGYGWNRDVGPDVFR